MVFFPERIIFIFFFLWRQQYRLLEATGAWNKNCWEISINVGSRCSSKRKGKGGLMTRVLDCARQRRVALGSVHRSREGYGAGPGCCHCSWSALLVTHLSLPAAPKQGRGINVVIKAFVEMPTQNSSKVGCFVSELKEAPATLGEKTQKQQWYIPLLTFLLLLSRNRKKIKGRMGTGIWI